MFVQLADVVVEEAPFEQSRGAEQERFDQFHRAAFAEYHRVGGAGGQFEVGFAVAVAAEGAEEHGVERLRPVASATVEKTHHVAALAVEALDQQPVQQADAACGRQVAQPQAAFVAGGTRLQRGGGSADRLRYRHHVLGQAFVFAEIDRRAGSRDDLENDIGNAVGCRQSTEMDVTAPPDTADGYFGIPKNAGRAVFFADAVYQAGTAVLQGQHSRFARKLWPQQPEQFDVLFHVM